MDSYSESDKAAWKFAQVIVVIQELEETVAELRAENERLRKDLEK